MTGSHRAASVYNLLLQLNKVLSAEGQKKNRGAPVLETQMIAFCWRGHWICKFLHPHTAKPASAENPQQQSHGLWDQITTKMTLFRITVTSVGGPVPHITDLGSELLPGGHAGHLGDPCKAATSSLGTESNLSFHICWHDIELGQNFLRGWRNNYMAWITRQTGKV